MAASSAAAIAASLGSERSFFFLRNIGQQGGSLGPYECIVAVDRPGRMRAELANVLLGLLRDCTGKNPAPRLSSA